MKATGTLFSKIKNSCKSILLFAQGKHGENVEFDQQYWDTLYGSGRWDFLHNLSELAHYSVLVGYCQYFAPEGAYLEVGCGEGILQQRLTVLPYSTYVGIDISQEAIRSASRFADERTRFMACDALNFQSAGVYDLILFNESLYCFNECLQILEHFRNMLNDDGLFIISMHVQDVSMSHWAKIDKAYTVVDAVSIENNKAVRWKCKAIRPQR